MSQGLSVQVLPVKHLVLEMNVFSILTKYVHLCYILFTSRTMFDKVILVVISTAHHCNLAQLFHKNLTFDYILVFLCGFSLIMTCIYTSAGYKYILLNVK